MTRPFEKGDRVRLTFVSGHNVDLTGTIVDVRPDFCNFYADDQCRERWAVQARRIGLVDNGFLVVQNEYLELLPKFDTAAFTLRELTR